MAKSLIDGDMHVELTYDHLDPTTAMNRVKSPKAGAVVLFAGMLLHAIYRTRPNPPP